MDNYATHKHADVRKWLARNSRVHLHFTPTSGSWMNLAKVFFGIITRQAIRRDTFPSVADLIAAIRRFIDAWNERYEPFARCSCHAVVSVLYADVSIPGRHSGSGQSSLFQSPGDSRQRFDVI